MRITLLGDLAFKAKHKLSYDHVSNDYVPPSHHHSQTIAGVVLYSKLPLPGFFSYFTDKIVCLHALRRHSPGKKSYKIDLTKI